MKRPGIESTEGVVCRQFAGAEGALEVRAGLKRFCEAKCRCLRQRLENRRSLSLCDGRRLSPVVGKTGCYQRIEWPVGAMQIVLRELNLGAVEPDVGIV